MYTSFITNTAQCSILTASNTINNANIYYQLSKFYKSFKRNLSKSKK
ncbi:hypothetical protein [Brachyspira innocens]|nr:hypothetical protein [Brachyspira innocens]